MLETHKVLLQEGSYRLSWYDAEQTILIAEVFSLWTWNEAHAGVQVLNDAIRATDRNVYSVYYFTNQASVIPYGTNALQNLKLLLQVSMPNERLIIIVGQQPVTRYFVNLVTKVYQLVDEQMKYRFVATLEEAVHLIQAHKRQHQGRD